MRHLRWPQWLESLNDRCNAAWDGWFHKPHGVWVVAELIEPIGWHVAHEFSGEAKARAFLAQHGTGTQQVMTLYDWEVAALAYLRSPEPWIRYAGLLAQVQELREEASLRGFRTLTAFAQEATPGRGMSVVDESMSSTGQVPEDPHG